MVGPMKVVIGTLAASLAIAMVGVFAPASGAAVTSPSPACERLNDPSLDGTYGTASGTGRNFSLYTYPLAAGEQIVISVSSPSAGGLLSYLEIYDSPSTIVNLSGTPPNDLTYTTPVDLDGPNMSLDWGVSSGTATFAVSCVPVPAGAQGAPPPDHVQQVEGVTDCTAVDETTLPWGRSFVGGWSRSWAQWANGGAGGPVCTRTISYRHGAWQVVT